jgi:hypothetical protein
MDLSPEILSGSLQAGQHGFRRIAGQVRFFDVGFQPLHSDLLSQNTRRSNQATAGGKEFVLSETHLVLHDRPQWSTVVKSLLVVMLRRSSVTGLWQGCA